MPWVTVAILLAGILTVVGGILALRLHAFLALMLGALLVGILTPRASVERYALEEEAIPVRSIDPARGEATLDLDAAPGTVYLALRPQPETGRFAVIAELRIVRIEDVEGPDGKGSRRSVAQISVKDGGAALVPGDLVIHPIAYRAARKLARQPVGERVARGFGATCAKIGILIAMAAIIGKCLLDSGAADRIVRRALRITGERGAPLAFSSSGFLLGIPVFFDTVFYLMIPLGKAMRMRTGHSYLFYVMAIVGGATMAHSLVPPTPGPLFVAEQIGVDLGTMILAGCAVGILTSGSGYVYAHLANRRHTLPLRESPDLSLRDLEAVTRRDEKELPPLWLSLLPILLPVILIAGLTVLKPFRSQIPPGWMALATTLGDKNLALVISAGVAMGMLVWRRRTSLKELAASVQAALSSGGVIILITAAGGAFGAILQQTAVAGLIRGLPQGSPLLILPMAFLITAAIRTAQGSATVAMITAVGILSGFSSPGVLGFHPVYLALAIGCGSKCVLWMNDSGFWVIGRMSGMTEAETLKYVTPMMALMGVVGLLVILGGVTLFPLV